MIFGFGSLAASTPYLAGVLGLVIFVWIRSVCTIGYPLPPVHSSTSVEPGGSLSLLHVAPAPPPDPTLYHPTLYHPTLYHPTLYQARALSVLFEDAMAKEELDA